MDDLLQQIADHLRPSLPDRFDRAWIDAEIDDGYVETQCWVELDGTTTQPDVPAADSFEIGGLLEDVRGAMPGPPATWSRCTFTLLPDGQFKFDVHHGD